MNAITMRIKAANRAAVKDCADADALAALLDGADLANLADLSKVVDLDGLDEIPIAQLLETARRAYQISLGALGEVQPVQREFAWISSRRDPFQYSLVS